MNKELKGMVAKMTNEEYNEYMRKEEVERKKSFDEYMQSRICVVEDFEKENYFIADLDSEEDYIFFQNYFSGKNKNFYNIIKRFKTVEEAQNYIKGDNKMEKKLNGNEWKSENGNAELPSQITCEGMVYTESDLKSMDSEDFEYVMENGVVVD